MKKFSIIYYINEKANLFKEFFTQAKLNIRPNSSLGLWVPYLIPCAIWISYKKNEQSASYLYKLATIACVGFFGSTGISIIRGIKGKPLHTFNLILPSFMAFLFNQCLHTGFMFSMFSGIVSTILYEKSVFLVLKHFPFCFSFGEAALAAQGVLLFLYLSLVNIHKAFYDTPVKISDISTIILQVGFLGVGVICLSVYFVKYLRKAVPFYTYFLAGIVFFILVPLHLLLKRSPLLWIGEFLFEDFETAKLFLYWAICVVVSVVVLQLQIKSGSKASTVQRKTFHFLAVAIYLPGLICQCTLLHLASGIVLALFIVLEMLRQLNLPPLGAFLQDGYALFADQQDSGNVALTPMYLLVGCSLPVWIHPSPCDITDSAGFNLIALISGLSSVGIGDAFASMFGTWCGRHHWTGSNKTIEGTVANIVSQLIFVYGLIYFGYGGARYDSEKMLLGTIISSLVEARTDQVDNLVTPLVLYLFLL